MEHNFRRADKQLPVRTVPAFTIQAYQKNTKVLRPPKSSIYRTKPLHPTEFRAFYDRRRLPIAVSYNTTRREIRWLADISKLDHEYYLPVFFKGLAEICHPYELVVYRGIFDLIDYAGGDILRTLPLLVQSMKNALRTNHPRVVVNVCKVIQKLSKHSQLAGLSLVRYYGDLLPVMRLYKDLNVNLGDGIEYGQRKDINVGDTIRRTLEVLEMTGGEGAYHQIKYYVPTYTSVLHN